MIQCEVLTPWKGSGTQTDPYRPQFRDDYPAATYTDVTGQPCSALVPSPNLYSIVAVMSDTDYAALQGNNTYQILWDGAI
jgi:hypothetical protein